MRQELVFGVTIVALPAQAQQPAPRDSIRPQFEPSYVVFSLLGTYAPKTGPGPHHILLEASVAPPFYIASWAHNAIVLTPKIILRQFAGESWPVRPPSFMPRATYYHWWSDGRHGVNYFSFMVSHHSNGQEQSHRNPDSTLNHVDGNFSTNFVEAAYEHLFRLPSLADVEGSLRVSVEAHIPGMYESAEMRDYSKVRPAVALAVRLGSHKEWSAGIVQGLLLGSAGNSFNRWRRLTHWGTLAWELPGNSDVSLFMNWYLGQDYYNNNYDQYRRLLRFGIGGGRGRAPDDRTIPRLPAAF
jgi:hypothetical protein